MPRRTLRAAFAVAATLAFSAPPSPAWSDAPAHLNVCAATGNLGLDSGLYYPVVGPSVEADMESHSSTAATCFFLIVSLHIHGWCGNATGDMTVYDGGGYHTGFFEIVGTTIVFFGPGIYGTAEVAPSPGQSCTPGGAGASDFLYSGVLIFV